MHKLTELTILIPLLSLVSYSALLLIVIFSKPQLPSKRIFREYLLAMAIWSLAAFIVLSESGDILFWFKVMTAAAVGAMLGMFHFIQNMLPKRVSWDKWAYCYGIGAMLVILLTDWVVSSAEMVNGVLTYSFASAMPLTAGPGYILTIFNLIKLFQGHREARDPNQRNRYLYLIIGLIVIPLGSVTNFTPLGRYPIDVAANLITALLISYAILRHQLLDIRLVIRKSLLYTIPTILIGTGYFLIISLALNILHASTGLQILSLSIIVAVLTALIAEPFRMMAQTWIDKLFFRERYDSSQMLQRVSQTASSVIDLDQLTNLILDETANTMHVEKAALFLKSRKNSGGYHPIAQKGRTVPTNLKLEENHPLVEWLSKNPQPLMKQDLSAIAWFKSLWDREAEVLKIIGAEIFIPMKAKGEMVGIITLGPMRSEQTYANEDQVMLMTLANNVAVAVQNAQLYTLAQRELTERRRAEKGLQLQLRRLSALQNINIAIAATIDLQIPLLLLLEQVVNELKVDAADVLLLNPSSQCLEYVAARGFRTDALKYTRLPLGHGLAGKAAVEKNTIYIKDLAQISTTLSQSPLIIQEKFVSYFGAPLIAKGQMKGVLEVFHRSSLKPNKEWLDFLNTLTSETAIAVDNAQLFKDLEQSNINLSEAYETTLEGWASTLELRDRETEGHSKRVTDLTLKLAQKLGVKEKDLIHIHRGTLLHDIGKMGIPDKILFKEGPLSKEEWKIMHQHPIFAFQMLSNIPFLKPAMDIPYCHHEKWDGTGYPRGLKGKAIPIAARIFAIVDVWDALLSDRPYRKAWQKEEVITYIQDQAGKHFDPKVVDAFMQIIGEKPRNNKVATGSNKVATGGYKRQ